MRTTSWLASASLAVVVFPALYAEPHCPGNVASLPFRLLIGYHIVVPVYINHSGPYQFLVDTGTRTTMVGASLADELHLEAHGAAAVAGLGFREHASLAQLGYLEAGSHAVAKQSVLVYGMLNLRSVDRKIRGILGEDFLEHVDVLIDYAHSLLCLDDTMAMRTEIKGPHIALLPQDKEMDGGGLPNLLVIAARLSGEPRPVRLMLDAGSNIPYLYKSAQHKMSQPTTPLVWTGPDGKEKLLSALLPQEVKIASIELPRVTFFTLDLAARDSNTREFDGFLPMNLFASVFISQADHFAVLQPR